MLSATWGTTARGTTPSQPVGRAGRETAVHSAALTPETPAYLLYTGITCGKQLVVLVGQKKALAMAVKNHLGRRRWTKLAEWLAADVQRVGTSPAASPLRA
jgi:hypothetical protein